MELIPEHVDAVGHFEWKVLQELRRTALIAGMESIFYIQRLEDTNDETTVVGSTWQSLQKVHSIAIPGTIAS